MKDVGATLVIALLPTDVARKPGDHKGRPYQQAMLADAAWTAQDQRSYSAGSP